MGTWLPSIGLNPGFRKSRKETNLLIENHDSREKITADSG